jgi:hypothetical protein
MILGYLFVANHGYFFICSIESLVSALTASSPCKRSFRDGEIILADDNLLGFAKYYSTLAQNYYQFPEIIS